MPKVNWFRDSSYLPTLDGWRAVAIGYVALSHSLIVFWPDSIFLRSGALGVWVFFAISGLLICTRLLREESSAGHISLRSFYIRRLARIQPAALVFLGLLGLLELLKVIPFNRWMMLGDLFQFEDYVDYVQGAGTGGGSIQDWYGRHFWSLSVEEHFYLILPFLLLLIVRHRERIFLIITGLLMTWSFFATRAARLTGHEVIHRTDFILTGLLIPAIFAIWLRHDGVAEYFAGWLPWACVALLPFLIKRDPHYPLVRSLNLDVTIPIMFSVMIISTVQNPDSLLGRFLEQPWMRYIGRISYSLYLYQQLFFVSHFPKAAGFLGKLQTFPLNFLCAITAAVVSYYLIEKPFIRIGHRWASRASSAKKSASTATQNVSIA